MCTLQVNSIKTSNMMDRVKLVIINLTVGYGSEDILLNFNLEMSSPGLVQVIGPNGAGKSTLFKAILGLLKPKKGRILVNGLDITSNPELASRFFSYVPQLVITERAINFPISVYEFLESELLFSRYKWPRIFISKEETDNAIQSVLEKVNLQRDQWHSDIRDLSGGQKQKVLIARALLNDRPAMIMDEPFSSIDPLSRKDISQLIKNLSREKLVILSSHDPMLLIDSTDMLVLLNRSFYYYGNPKDVLRREVLEKIYGETIQKVSEDHYHIFDEGCMPKKV